MTDIKTSKVLSDHKNTLPSAASSVLGIRSATGPGSGSRLGIGSGLGTGLGTGQGTRQGTGQGTGQRTGQGTRATAGSSQGARSRHGTGSSAGSNTGSLTSAESIRVVVRVRPESFPDQAAVLNIVGDQIQINRSRKTVRNAVQTTTYQFDKVFVDSTQEDIYQYVGQDVVQAVLRGYNACVFAYGQTGSGKTYTMSNVLDVGNVGLIPRIVESLLTSGARIEMSFVELYNETPRDLLDPSSGVPLKCRDRGKLGCYVEGLRVVAVDSFEAFATLYTFGCEARHTSATRMNEASSRSHSILSITVTTESSDRFDQSGGRRLRSILNLVDLAGSERVDKSGVVGGNFVEAANINFSLSSLGCVIRILAGNQGKTKKDHVPYRDSLLTRLLADSIGGNSKTFMIANISPDIANLSETISTLEYASKTKQIKNTAVVNDNSTMIADLKRQIEQLKATKPTQDSKEELSYMEEMLRKQEQSYEEKLKQSAEWVKAIEEKYQVETAKLIEMQNNITEKNRQLEEQTKQLTDQNKQLTDQTRQLTDQTRQLTDQSVQLIELKERSKIYVEQQEEIGNRIQKAVIESGVEFENRVQQRVREHSVELKAAHEAEVEKLRVTHDSEVEKLRVTHDSEVEKLRVTHDSEVEKLRDAHNSEMDSQRHAYEEQVKRLEAKLAIMEEHYESQLKNAIDIGIEESDLKVADYKNSIASLNEQASGYQQTIADLNERISDYTEQINTLREKIQIDADKLSSCHAKLLESSEEHKKIHATYALQIEQLTAENSKLTSANDRLNSMVVDLTNRLNEANIKLTTSKETQAEIIKKLTSEKIQLIRQVQSLYTASQSASQQASQSASQPASQQASQPASQPASQSATVS